MSSQALMEKMEARQHYRNMWRTDLLGATAADPIFCFFSFLCGPCASYLLRKRALYNDLSRYTCCGGYMPCSGRCGESECPELCLCSEVFCCFNSSVASTRFMLQDEFNIQTTECDNCIIGFMFCLQQLACIFSIIACILGSEDIAEAADLLKCLADLVYCTDAAAAFSHFALINEYDPYESIGPIVIKSKVPCIQHLALKTRHVLANKTLSCGNELKRVCPCMQTQHKVELDKRDEQLGITPVMAVPPTQQMSRMDQPMPPPPSASHPPPPAPGYPVSSYPPYPQPPQGQPPYPQPPQGYPPYPQSPPQGYPPYPKSPEGHPTYPQSPPQPQVYPPYPQSPPQGHPTYPQSPPQGHPPYPQPPQGQPPYPKSYEGQPPYPQSPPQAHPPYPQPPQGHQPYPQPPHGYPPVSYPPPSGPYPPSSPPKPFPPSSPTK